MELKNGLVNLKTAYTEIGQTAVTSKLQSVSDNGDLQSWALLCSYHIGMLD